MIRGVDYGDVVRLSRSILGWDDWLPAWTEVADEHAALAREWEAGGSAGQAWNRAALGYHFGRFLSVRDPAAYHACSERAVAALREAHRLLDPSARRIKVGLDGARMVATVGGTRSLLSRDWGRRSGLSVGGPPHSPGRAPHIASAIASDPDRR